MPRPDNSERFEHADYHAPQGWPGIAASSPMGLAMLAILMAGGLATIASPRQADAETAIVVANAAIGSIRDADARAVTASDLRALLSDPAIGNFKGLSENAWDFNDPDGIPGFGRLPGSSQELRLAESAMK